MATLQFFILAFFPAGKIRLTKQNNKNKNKADDKCVDAHQHPAGQGLFLFYPDREKQQVSASLYDLRTLTAVRAVI